MSHTAAYTLKRKKGGGMSVVANTDRIKIEVRTGPHGTALYIEGVYVSGHKSAKEELYSWIVRTGDVRFAIRKGKL